MLKFPYPPPATAEFGSDWGGTKVLWFVAPRYRGPVLIRGRMLDTPVEVRFDRGAVPPDELRIPTGWRRVRVPGHKLVGQRYVPSYMRLKVSGCYAYQIDGTSFSRTIVFRAIAVPE